MAAVAFIAGLFIGATAGVLTLALCVAAKRRDNQDE